MSGGRLAKPQLRDLHLSYVKRSLVLMSIFTLSLGFTYKLLVSDVYERKMEEFYKNYDAEESLKRMIDAGLMHFVKK